jgi:hypothetical protein
MLRGIGNIGSPWVGAGVCLQVVADRAASKHFGDFRNLGKSGPRADHTRRHTVDDTAVPEFGEEQVDRRLSLQCCFSDGTGIAPTRSGAGFSGEQ